MALSTMYIYTMLYMYVLSMYACYNIILCLLSVCYNLCLRISPFPSYLSEPERMEDSNLGQDGGRDLDPMLILPSYHACHNVLYNMPLIYMTWREEEEGGGGGGRRSRALSNLGEVEDGTGWREEGGRGRGRGGEELSTQGASNILCLCSCMLYITLLYICTLLLYFLLFSSLYPYKNGGR